MPISACSEVQQMDPASPDPCQEGRLCAGSVSLCGVYCPEADVSWGISSVGHLREPLVCAFVSLGGDQDTGWGDALLSVHTLSSRFSEGAATCHSAGTHCL